MNSDFSAPLDLAVIGAGFCGRMLLAQLVRQHPRPAGLALSMSDPRLDIGPGRAWSDVSGLWSANVPAANLSAWPDRPDDFVDWWSQACTKPAVDLRHAYAARAQYGEYLRAVWRQALARCGASVQEHATAVIGLHHVAGCWQLLHADGTTLRARRVVLATGNPAPQAPAGLEAADARLPDPLDADRMAALPPAARVLILGSGLSAVDALQTLFQQRHQGPITLLSRHGLLPAAHAETPAGRAPWTLEALGETARTALSALRGRLGSCPDWRMLIDGLRPHTVALWRRWSLAERSRFLRHLRALWDVHRHRAAGVVHHQVLDGIAEHPVERLCGRLLRIETLAGGLRAHWLPRGLTTHRTLDCDVLLNATSTTALALPLVQDLLDAGTLRTDPLQLGLALDADGRTGAPGLYALGPLARGRDWETTAIPELREHAARLAALLCTEESA